mmetsp:Transcript_23962/g.26476  ORF Transcript_23962/g.26476 Transcript_23962/m.26476 type:complete len:126 (+) Transcript_23962:2-379(+)
MKRNTEEEMSIAALQRRNLQELERASELERAQYKEKKRKLEKQRRAELDHQWNTLLESVQNISSRENVNVGTQTKFRRRTNNVTNQTKLVESSTYLIKKMHCENREKDITIMKLKTILSQELDKC